MTGNLLVTPEKLLSTSQEFADIGNTVQSLTQQMIQIVSALKSTWAGEANTAYDSKFHALEDDMTRMHRMIQEHVSDLQEMAKNYQSAESANVQTSNALSGDVII